MLSKSIVKQAAASSRRAVMIVLAGAALISAALIAERVIYQADQSAARSRLVEAHETIARLWSVGQQQSMAANLAVATGEERWMALYDQTVPEIDAVLETAWRLAPADVAQELAASTERTAQEMQTLVQAAFAEARAGNLAAARAILQGQDYTNARAQLVEAGGELLDGVALEAEETIRARDNRATAALIGIIATAFLCGVIVWRRLSRGLRRTEAALSSAEDVIREMAQTDVLTGVGNRRALFEKLDAAIARAAARRGCVVATMIDLDRFKPVNDRHGHVTGDLVLKEIACRLRATLRHGQFIARVGGDEFVAVIETESASSGVDRLADRIIDVLSRPIDVGGVTVQVGASVGVASYPADTKEAKELVRMADVALYAAKGAGRGRCEHYSRAADADAAARTRIEQELRRAIESGGIVPFFQPIVSLETGQVTGFEALSRWRRPEQGLIGPAKFIPVAERCGLIDALTVASLRAACAAARDMPVDMKLAFNLSAQQVQDEWLAEKVMGVLTQAGFLASKLEIDLTENALVNDLAAAKRVITSLKNLGVRIALDDFGTGYSSLCYLSELPFDTIKIDSSFVHSMRERRESAKVVMAIIALGRSLGATIVAEGVETEDQAAALRELGCTQAQGWLYARAMPAEDALALAGLELPVRDNVIAMRRA